MNSDLGPVGALGAACGVKGGTIRQVKADGTGAYLTIQHALNNSVNGDIVELADGVYTVILAGFLLSALLDLAQCLTQTWLCLSNLCLESSTLRKVMR